MNPTYQSGFYAPGRGGVPKYPSLWRDRIGSWAPSLGPTGLSIVDSSISRNHGTATNMSATAWSIASGTNALKLDGVDDYVAIGSPQSLGNINVTTWEAWILPVVVFTRQTLVWKGSDANAIAAKLLEITGSGKLRCRITATVSADVSGVSTIVAGQWNHLAMTFDGSRISLYLNGSLDGVSGAATGTILDESSLEMRFGGRIVLGGIPYSGYFGNIGIYSRVLSQREIRLLVSSQGIAYEPSLRKVYSVPAPLGTYKPYLQNHRSQIIGGGLK